MNDETTTQETAPAKPRKSTKASVNGKPKEKVVLRTAQIRILKVLSRSKGGTLSKSQICDRIAAEFPTAAKYQGWMSGALGTSDKDASKKTESRLGYPSLITLGFVRPLTALDGGNPEYTITGAGRRAYNNR